MYVRAFNRFGRCIIFVIYSAVTHVSIDLYLFWKLYVVGRNYTSFTEKNIIRRSYSDIVYSHIWKSRRCDKWSIRCWWNICLFLFFACWTRRVSTLVISWSQMWKTPVTPVLRTRPCCWHTHGYKYGSSETRLTFSSQQSGDTSLTESFRDHVTLKLLDLLR